MFSIDDPRWATLKGGYHILYDPRPALWQLAAGENVVDSWKELWNELHHQGDVDDASYAVIPHLVHILSAKAERDWNFYAIISTIEIARHRKNNPPLPVWLADDYFRAWDEIVNLGLRDFPEAHDDVTVQSILGALAIAKKKMRIGALIADLDDSEIAEILENHLSWSQVFDEKR